jgi:hypothetical protein
MRHWSCGTCSLYCTLKDIQFSVQASLYTGPTTQRVPMLLHTVDRFKCDYENLNTE